VNEAFDLRESDINLDVSYALKALLEGDGAEVALTRSDDSDKSDSERYSYCNEQQATILLSVHTNSVNNPWLDGSLALYLDQDDQVLAEAIYDRMHPFLAETAPGPTFFMRFGLDRFVSAVLQESEMPAVIMEPLLMSNPAEAEGLVQPIYKDPVAGIYNERCKDLVCRRGQIARALHRGVLNYFGDDETSLAPDVGGIAQLTASKAW
jgi:N-acetylmuramoyl-L-alanine amidase